MHPAFLVRVGWIVLLGATTATGKGIAQQPTFHLAYDKALRFGGEPHRGIVLLLHGCEGLGGTLPGWQAAWVRYLIDRGFLVVVPNSFADPRPERSCAAPFPDKEQIYALRLQQTTDAIARLRRAYPTVKLLVWGHSEGAGVANRIEARVDGIVTTGYQCGYRSSARMFLSPQTPLLVIVGDRDSYASEAIRVAGAESVEDVCRRLLTSPRWLAVMVPGMGHGASLEEAQVEEALQRFLDLAAPPPDTALLASAASTAQRVFPQHPPSAIDGVFQNARSSSGADQDRYVESLKEGRWLLTLNGRPYERYGYTVDFPKAGDFDTYDMLGMHILGIYETSSDGFRWAALRDPVRQSLERPRSFADTGIVVTRFRRVSSP